MSITTLENLTVAFIVYARWNIYGHHNKENAAKFIQKVAQEQNIKVKIRNQKGNWGEGSPKKEYTQILEVYGNDFDRLLKIRRAIGNYLSWANSGWGYCHRCHTPWFATKSHSTGFGQDWEKGEGFTSQGCFPLCEWCWSQLTPEERWPYYQQLILEWESSDYHLYDANEEHQRTFLKEAVFAGR